MNMSRDGRKNKEIDKKFKATSFGEKGVSKKCQEKETVTL